MLSPLASLWPWSGVIVQDHGHPHPENTLGSQGILTFGPGNCQGAIGGGQGLEASSCLQGQWPPKGRPGGQDKDKAETDMAVGCTPQSRAQSVDVRGPLGILSLV